MLWLATKLPTFWKYRKFIGYAAGAILLVVAFLWYRHSLIEIGRNEVRAEWKADSDAREVVVQRVLAEDRQRMAENEARNQEIDRATDEKLAAIAADRDNLSGLLRRADDRIRSLASAKATGDIGVSVATGIAARAEEARRAIESQYDAYDRACQRDAVRLQALQDQIRPQL